MHLTDEAEPAGLGPEQRRAAADAAAAAGLDGWLLELVNTTGQDWLARLDRQDVRRRVFEASVGRGASGPNATGATVVELARLRARRAALEARGLAPGLVPPRYRSRCFSHVWGGGHDGGAYYAYTWAEVHDADVCARFAEQEVDGDDGLNRAAGERFRREVLAPGGSVDPAAAYRAFRGADPDVAHLVRRRTRGPER